METGFVAAWRLLTDGHGLCRVARCPGGPFRWQADDSSSVAFRIVLGGGCQQEANVESRPSLPRAPTRREGGSPLLRGRAWGGGFGGCGWKALRAESQRTQVSLAKGLASRLQTEARGLACDTDPRAAARALPATPRDRVQGHAPGPGVDGSFPVSRSWEALVTACGWA